MRSTSANDVYDYNALQNMIFCKLIVDIDNSINTADLRLTGIAGYFHK